MSDSDKWYATKEVGNTCQALGDGAQLNKQVICGKSSALKV